MKPGKPELLPAGRRLVSWLAAASGPGGLPRRLLWAYRWKGYWFDRNWRFQELLHPVHPFEGPHGGKLIFILGYWRSGTTFLHELLASGPGMASPQTWQCMNPSAFRIARPPLADGGRARPMDAIIVNATSPQEDEFALLARGAPSVYRAWLDPRRWQEVLPALAQETWLALPQDEWFSDWRRFLGWCTPADAAALVVKSPNHVFRLKAIHRAWPEARFAWTLRDPADTWFSNRKMWRAMTALYGGSDWRADELDRLLFQAFVEYAAALRWAAASLPRERLAFVDFARLGAAAPETLAALTGRFGLGSWQSWLPRLQARLDEAARHSPERYAADPPLPDYARPAIEEIRELHRGLLEERAA